MRAKTRASLAGARRGRYSMEVNGSSHAMRFGGLAVVVAVTAGCTLRDVQCECAQSGLTIVAAGLVSTVSVSGAACAGASVRCGGPDFTLRAGCEYYYVAPVAEGACKVDLTLVGRSTQTRTFNVRHFDGECCAGFYVDGDPSFRVVP